LSLADDKDSFKNRPPANPGSAGPLPDQGVGCALSSTGIQGFIHVDQCHGGVQEHFPLTTVTPSHCLDRDWMDVQNLPTRYFAVLPGTEVFQRSQILPMIPLHMSPVPATVGASTVFESISGYFALLSHKLFCCNIIAICGAENGADWLFHCVRGKNLLDLRVTIIPKSTTFLGKASNMYGYFGKY
jgi:hypothetical protein